MLPNDELVNSAERFSLGVDQESGRRYISIPVANRLVDYEEFYELTSEEYLKCICNAMTAAQVAQQCRENQLDSRLIVRPGSDRGIGC